MLRSQRRLVALVLTVPLLVLAGAFGYMLLMNGIEETPRTFLEAVSWAAETLSTTGYGADTRWTHPVTVVYVIALQFIGVFLVFLIFPIYLIPFLEERFEQRLPVAAPDLEGHVMIFRHGAAVQTLIEELEKTEIPALIVEPDESEARRIDQLGRRVVHGRLVDDVLERAGLARARALVVNGADDENANAILAARQEGFDRDIFSFVEEPTHRRALELAGATRVLTPRHILGSALAARASHRIDPARVGVHVFDGRLLVREIRIEPGSELEGRSLAEARVGERTGATVLGQWTSGEIDPLPTPATRLHAGSLAIAAGSAQSLDELARLCGDEHEERGRFVVAGAGEVGSRVAHLLREVGEDVLVIDRRPGDGVDEVGDALDEEVLKRAGAPHARGVVLALDRDSSTLFATVILRDIAPHVPVIARVNHSENISRIYQAGAQFALSISQVSGRMLALHLLGEDAVELHPELKLVRVSSKGLVGRHPADLALRRRTGCSIVAVGRGGEILTQLDGAFTFEAGDTVYVCGSMTSTRRYLEVFPQ